MMTIGFLLGAIGYAITLHYIFLGNPIACVGRYLRSHPADLLIPAPVALFFIGWPMLFEGWFVVGVACLLLSLVLGLAFMPNTPSIGRPPLVRLSDDQ